MPQGFILLRMSKILPVFMYRSFFKPVFDRILAIIAILLLLPLFIIISLAIRLDTKGPVFFRQARLGRNGKVFYIFKFRSMVSDQSSFKKPLKIYEDDPRITAVGSLLRKTSLDELPQLINIARGEMSFLGPRPPLTWFPKPFEEYTEFEKQRFDVKPGLSGLAQVTCREIHDWDVKIPIDIEYVNNLSFINDLKLFMISLLSFFRTDNIYSQKSN